MSQLSRQGSYELRSSQDFPMGDAPELTNSQMSAVLDYDERLEDGLATEAAKPARKLPAWNPPARKPAAGKGKGKEAAQKGAATKRTRAPSPSYSQEPHDNASQNDFKSICDDMEAGGQLISRFAGQQSQSQETQDDDDDYEEQRYREEFNKHKTVTWMQKKLDKTTADLEKLVKQHDDSKKELVKPVNDLIKIHPEKKKSLLVMLSLLNDSCTDDDVRDTIISSANVLESQQKMLSSVGRLMMENKVGNECLEKKKAEEAFKRGEGSNVMSAAAALLGNASSKRQRRK